MKGAYHQIEHLASRICHSEKPFKGVSALAQTNWPSSSPHGCLQLQLAGLSSTARRMRSSSCVLSMDKTGQSYG